MKLRKSLTRGVGAVSIASLLVACGDKEPTTPVTPPSDGSTPNVQVTDKPVAAGDVLVAPTASLSLEERAELMGFAKYLSKDYEVFASVDVGMIRDTLSGTEFGKLMLEDLDVEEGPVTSIQDAFFAAGPGVGDQIKIWYRFLNEINKLTTLSALETAAVDAGLLDAEDVTIVDPSDIFEALPVRFQQDFDSYIQDIEALELPPMMWGAALGDGMEEMTAEMADAQQGLAEMMPPFVQRVDIDNGENEQFVLFRLLVGDMIDKESFRESMEGIDLTDAEFERFYAALAKKTVVMGFGVKDDYVVGFVGSSEEQLAFADSIDQSVVSKEAASFVDGYSSKKLAHVMVADEETLTKLKEGAYTNPFGMYTGPLRDVLGRIDKLGDKRDLMAMLDRTDELVTEMYAMNTSASAGVGIIEDGIKFEYRGGLQPTAYDFDKPLQFGGFADADNMVMSYGVGVTEDSLERGIELYDVVGQLTYAITKRYVGLDATPDQMKEMFDFVDGELADDLLTVWGGVKGQWIGGLGTEGVLLVDASGEMPRFAGVPSEITESGKIPRAAVVYPITDRTKLAGSWDTIEPALRSVIEKVAAKNGQTFTLPDSTTSQTDGITFYSYPVTGFTNDDLVPVLALSDDYFILASSKKFAAELVAKLKSGSVKPIAGGAFMNVDLTTIRDFGREWVELARTHPSLVAEAPVLQEIFDDVDGVEQVLDWAEVADGFSLRIHKDAAGEMRTSLHLTLKDLPADALERINDEEEVDVEIPEPPVADEEDLAIQPDVEIRLGQ